MSTGKNMAFVIIGGAVAHQPVKRRFGSRELRLQKNGYAKHMV